MSDPFGVVRQFESELCSYTGAAFAVTTTSCTAALLLAVAWHLRKEDKLFKLAYIGPGMREFRVPLVEIPRCTYASVPMSIVHAGGRPTFRDEDWRGAYQLKPLPVWDSARRFTSGMYRDFGRKFSYDEPRDKHIDTPGSGQFVCVSFHHSKILGDTQGGAILHDDPEADKWLRRARFDGRTEGVEPKDDDIMLGWHCYMSPDVAARLLWKLSKLPLQNEDLPNDAYPDLSAMECFK